jgi:hypothetical protein
MLIVSAEREISALRHRLGERAEHGDLLGARATEILREQRFTLRVEATARARHHLFRVAPRLERWIDARHAQASRTPAQVANGLLDVGSRIGRRQRDGNAATRELAGDARGHGRLADAALAHSQWSSISQNDVRARRSARDGPPPRCRGGRSR